MKKELVMFIASMVALFPTNSAISAYFSELDWATMESTNTSNTYSIRQRHFLQQPALDVYISEIIKNDKNEKIIYFSHRILNNNQWISTCDNKDYIESLYNINKQVLLWKINNQKVKMNKRCLKIGKHYFTSVIPVTQKGQMFISDQFNTSHNPIMVNFDGVMVPFSVNGFAKEWQKQIIAAL